MVNQFISLIENFYVHLPLKRSMLAVDPIQRGRLILNQLPEYSDDTAFLGDLISVFNELRDLHTNFVLPAPWQGLVAFLPFLVEGYRDENDSPRYIVSYISPYVDLGPDFVPGVEVTHWNAMPMVQAVLEFGPQTAGANPRAWLRRALATLTLRTLSSQLLPREDWVRLSYIGAKGPAQIEYPWMVMASPPSAGKPASDSGSSPLAMRLGIDYPSQEVQRARKRILFPERFEFEQRVNRVLQTSGRSAAEAMLGDTEHTSSLFPQNLSFGTVETPSGTFGYLRIWNFEVDDVEGFTVEIRRILQQAPESGIILDVRSNPGGTITAGERILQFFTDRRIDPEPVSFRATDLNRFMVEALQELAPWRRSLSLALRTGEVFSQGYPITSVEEANDKGRVYRGPVVVIIDAISYSTCDFFVAGFQDHKIGKVLGVDKSTGQAERMSGRRICCAKSGRTRQTIH
jgi:hypothetical protein